MYLIRSKCTTVSVITGKENASKDRNYVILMFLMSVNIYFVFGNACFMYIMYHNHVLKLLMLAYLTLVFWGQGLAFLVKTGWQPWCRALGSNSIKRYEYFLSYTKNIC